MVEMMLRLTNRHESNLPRPKSLPESRELDKSTQGEIECIYRIHTTRLWVRCIGAGAPYGFISSLESFASNFRFFVARFIKTYRDICTNSHPPKARKKRKAAPNMSFFDCKHWKKKHPIKPLTEKEKEVYSSGTVKREAS